MAASNKEKMWIAGGTAAAVLIAAASWFLLISPQFSSQADLEQQVADAQTQNLVLQSRLNSLREQASHTDELNSELGQLRAAVPGQHDLEGFTRQLTAFASAAGVTITSISPAAPSQITQPQAPAPMPTESEAASSTEETPAPTAPATPEGPAGNLYSVAVTVVTTGPMAAQRAFLAALEKQGDRRSLVSNVAFAPIDPTATAQPDETGAAADPNAGSESGTADASSTGSDAAAPTTTTEPPPPPPPSANDGEWTLTTQLLIFVAPQSPGDEAQLQSELGGNG